MKRISMWCKHCERYFRIECPERGDFFFECAYCGYHHYRHVEKGEPKHCDIEHREVDPVIVVKGK